MTAWGKMLRPRALYDVRESTSLCRYVKLKNRKENARGWGSPEKTALGVESEALGAVVVVTVMSGRQRADARALALQVKDHLWAGQVDEVIVTLQAHADRLGPPQAPDGPEHPRRVLANNVG